MKEIDFIGDIHGHADQLKALLSKLGYENKKGVYSHSERKVLFVGDYIDRGPDNPGVISLVRKMVEADQAIALMGNHEYNAICFNTLGQQGYLRPHSIKNFKQHAETMLQFQGNQSGYDDAIAWFKTLPLFYETEDFRAVHASWDNQSIQYLKNKIPNGIIPEHLIAESQDKGSDLFQAVEITCKGKETGLPDGVTFQDKDGTVRKDIRLKWWEDPEGKSFKDMSVVEGLAMEDSPYLTEDASFYQHDQKPVFFGHYWLKGLPNLYRNNVCCLDFSVAKNGYLCCYRYQGEKQLDNKNFVYV